WVAAGAGGTGSVAPSVGAGDGAGVLAAVGTAHGWGYAVTVSGGFRYRASQPEQALGVAGQGLLAFGRGARQAGGELTGEAGRGEGVVGAEQQAADTELGIAVFQRRGPVADGVDEELVQVLAHRPGQVRLARERRAGLAVDGQPLPQPGQYPAQMG